MIDTSTNRVSLTARAEIAISGDLTLRLRIPDPVRDLSANDAVSTTTTRRGLVESQTLEKPFAVHLPDNGHFGFFVAYSFEPGSTVSDEGPPLVRHGTLPIYVTMRDGAVVRYSLSPDPDYVGPITKAAPRGATRASTDQAHTITPDERHDWEPLVRLAHVVVPQSLILPQKAIPPRVADPVIRHIVYTAPTGPDT